jgi:hypothetical protein
VNDGADAISTCEKQPATGCNDFSLPQLCASGGARYVLSIGGSESSAALYEGDPTTDKDDVSVIASNDGKVRAYSFKGDILWTFTATTAVRASVIYDATRTPQLVYGVDANGLVFALDASDGRRCRNLTRTILALDRDLQQRTSETAPGLLALPGCGALSASKLLGEIGPIERFESDAQLARHAGVAPLEASSGKHRRHRLDRGGNRQLNCALHRIAVTQGRVHPPARAYLERKQNEGKTRREAIRCLKRLLVRVVFNTLKASPALT